MCRITKPTKAQTGNTQLNKKIRRRIFCLGDSLTAGVSPPHNTEYPYSTYLEKALQKQYSQYEYCVQSLASRDLYSIIESSTFDLILQQICQVNTTIPLLIICVGANNFNNRSVADFVDLIVRIHERAHEKGIQTIAVGIPPSTIQTRSEDTKLKADDANKRLKDWAGKKQYTGRENTNRGLEMVSFAPFPFGTGNNLASSFAMDGYHFTPEGYRCMGESLAPYVVNVFDNNFNQK
jgi:lysophospholipase L1-like esterase